MSGLTALVGREEELELLLRRWSRAKTGEGQVGAGGGEPGRSRASRRGSSVLRTGCPASLQAS